MPSDKRQPIGHQPAAAGPQHGQHGHEDDGLGAVEGERPSDPQRGNPQGPGIDPQGRPNAPVKTDQDRIGAELDETEG